MDLGAYNKDHGEAYVAEYLRLFPQRADSIKPGCESCYRDAYNRLVFHYSKQEKTTIMAKTAKYQFLGKEGKIYNFPSIGIFGVTVENFNDATGEKLFKSGKTEFVKEIKEKAEK